MRNAVGPHARIVGGGAVGVICSNAFGYAGDQIGLAAIWLDGIDCEMIVEGGLSQSEKDVGKRIGEHLAAAHVTRESPVMLFYDAINRTDIDMRLIVATPILEGIEKTLGFMPNLTGAGLQGDYICSPTRQFIGEGIGQHQAIALAFGEKLRIDSIIMHGCKPATNYYTVTRAEGQTILEIDGQPALQFVKTLLGPSIPPEAYAFFLIFGINRGEPWGEFDENNYASRLCLAIDPSRNGIVMFEPDMVEGTIFQIMHRSLDLDYMAPKIEKLFAETAGRKPVFAFYIDCAGRAAGYAGTDLEDAYVIQRTVKDKVPLLGIYSGVEIAPVNGVSRPLDWTGVFSLFSVPE